MKIFAIAASVLFAAVAYTAPAPVEDRAFLAVITFFAGPVQFVEHVPTDGSVFQIKNDLSVDHIKSDGGVTCIFYGKDGSVTPIAGTHLGTVAPPQKLLTGGCLAS